MRAAWTAMWLVAASAFWLGGVGCSAQPDESGDVCERATQRLDACGVSLPVSRLGACVGTREALARCLVTYANGCAELATIMRRADECVADMMDGGGFEDLEAPIVAPDASTDVRAARDATRDSSQRDAASEDNP